MEIDPDYWKEKYKSEWKSGANRVRYVLEVLKERFPNLTIEPKDYALREDYIPSDERHEKHDPNIIVKHQDVIICDIEVTGSYIKMMPPGIIFILRGKQIEAQERKREQEIDTWFYTVYLNSEYVLDLDLVEKFNGDKARVKYLKGVPERYIEIPCAQAYTREKLFEWIEQRKGMRKRSISHG